MLSLHQQRGKLRLANNLLPTSTGGMASRPGAYQVLSGTITHARPWGNRVLVVKQGRIKLWDGTQEIDIEQAGHGLHSTTYQALTSNAAREDRIYVGDSVLTMWYIARRNGAYARYALTNKAEQPDGTPYAVPVTQAIATWRGRLWISYGTNRIQHSQFDDPDYLDPLWTPEFQAKKPGRVVGLEPHGTTLFVGVTSGLWAVTGDSQYNWNRDQVSEYDVAGPDAMCSDGERFFWVSSVGLHLFGVNELLSDDIRDAFSSPQYPAHLVIDKRRQLLLLLVGGRIFVMHLNKPGQFGEIVGHQAFGLIQLDDYVGWYGNDGLWILGARDMPDRRTDGSTSAFESIYDTWEDIPNIHGNGRARLGRTKAVFAGSARSNVTYTVTAQSQEGTETATETASLTDTIPEKWSDMIAGLNGEEWPTAPVRREFVPQIAGTTFRHKFSAQCHMEVHALEPDYKFGGNTP